MARRRKIGDLTEKEAECYYCEAVIPASAMRCPECGKFFSSAKRLIAFSVALIVVVASLSGLVYVKFVGGHLEGGNGLIPINGNGPSTGDYKITFELYTSAMPITTKNFIDLANQGKYNGVKFHRVIDGFMIQGGDFTNGDGTGGHAAEHHPPYGVASDPNTWVIPDEFHPTETHSRGAVSMANAGANTGGSQFFIMQGDTRTDLDVKHAIFGRVTSGLLIVDEIAKLPNNSATMKSVAISTSGGKTYATIDIEIA